MKPQTRNVIALIVIVAVGFATDWVVNRFHTPGHLDVVAAQAMDMSKMRPPIGAAPVELASIRTGTLDDSVTYTGSVLAFNEQDITPRITGSVVSIPVYPGDHVTAGELVVQLDSAEISDKTQEAINNANAAQSAEFVAHLTHHVHHYAALSQSEAQFDSAQQGVVNAQAIVSADQDDVTGAQAAVVSAQASVDYWQTEIEREKQLASAGAASQQEYQDELSQADAAFAGLSQAQAKASQVKATVQAAEASFVQSQKQVDVGDAGVRMAKADITVAEQQANQATDTALAAQTAVAEALTVQGYSRIVAPASGVVTARPVAPGTLVQPGQVILKIAEIDTVRVQANVAIADLGGIHPGSSVQISLGDAGPQISSKVASVFPAADPDTRTSVVEADIPNPGHRLLPGAFVTMQITKHVDTHSLLVPDSAIVSSGGQLYVWVTNQSDAATGPIYECVICHIHYTAAQALKFHYIDPMDGGKLTPLTSTMPSPSDGPLTAHEVAVQVVGSDGTTSEVTSEGLTPDRQVIVQGVAGLTEGARIVATAWGPNGPITLPDAASANTGLTVYKCEKCGMTYSQADAKADHYIDPMDGGNLVPVKPELSQ